MAVYITKAAIVYLKDTWNYNIKATADSVEIPIYLVIN